MTDLRAELEEATERVGTRYCFDCFVRGFVEDGEPIVSEMSVRWSMLGERPYREDIMVKCTEDGCRHTQLYGFGLSEEEFNDKLERRGRKKLDVFQDNLVAEQRLRDLGYIE